MYKIIYERGLQCHNDREGRASAAPEKLRRGTAVQEMMRSSALNSIVDKVD
jgi:hypothetical protein